MNGLGGNDSGEFKLSCKHWRQYRKFSQLDLALAADVSQRHISWLETGRSRPSRDMVVRLAQAMDIPLRERNVFLNAAGFAALYSEKSLDEPSMAPVFDALSHVLKHHDPYPAFVVDRLWNIQMKNAGADLLLSVIGDADQLWRDIGDDGKHNIALLTLHPNGLRNYISNWQEAAPDFIRRLKKEAAASGDKELHEKIEAIIACAKLGNGGAVLDHSSDVHGVLPVLPLDFKFGDLSLSMFSVISTFGTPQDITTDELRIEAFYPADESSKVLFAQ